MHEKKELARGLKNRHVQLLAIGGAIGTGLFLGSGRSIHLAGPSILLAYIITGLISFFMMRALGELLLSNTDHHSFVDFVEEYIGPGAAFVTGWTYWFCWVSLAMADVTAAGVYIQYWIPNVETWIPSLCILLILFASNLMAVKIFGELEFWFALIKVIAILGLIGGGLYLIFIGYQTDVGPVSFSNLWSHGGWFPNGWEGFVLSFQMVVFAFTGIELVGLTAGETENPKKVIPQAINNIPIRIIIFYVGALAIIMSIYPWTAVNADSSPFVQVFKAAGIVAAAAIVNFIVLTSAASACNSGLFSTSRMVYTLAREGNAPRRMFRLRSNQVPMNAVVFSALVIFIAVIMQYIMPENVFILITSVSTFCFIFIWAIILVCHMKYRKQHPELAKQNPFKMPLYPLMNYVILGFYFLVLVSLAFNNETLIALLFTPVWFGMLWCFYKLQTLKQNYGN
ncbi:amino acid permease [uncultured Veillonella sp.]|uniref:amino acid permease n=1 Tax=uncultured Veillonella sp. TaxID=159268 RepID=UPI002671BD3D|nr:amino acid permease [uncultured Veillonella sp.]